MDSRKINGRYPDGCSLDEMAEAAAQHADAGIDPRSGYGVGAALSVRFDMESVPNQDFEYNIYGGCNIRLSGMEYTIHAEQMALFQALMDMEVFGLREYADLHRVLVITTENDMAIRCGHCLQTFYGACEFVGTDPEELEYIAATGKTTYGVRGPDGVHWNYEKYTLSDLFPQSYTTKVSRDE